MLSAVHSNTALVSNLASRLITNVHCGAEGARRQMSNVTMGFMPRPRRHSAQSADSRAWASLSKLKLNVLFVLSTAESKSIITDFGQSLINKQIATGVGVMRFKPEGVEYAPNYETLPCTMYTIGYVHYTIRRSYPNTWSVFVFLRPELPMVLNQ